MTNLSTTTAGRLVGGLFIAAFFLYGGGAYLLDSTADGATPLPENAASLGQLSAGAALMLANSAAVMAIGAMAFRVLRRRHSRTANSYLLTRAVEGVLLALPPGGILTLMWLGDGSAATPEGDESWLGSLARASVENGDTTYWIAMTSLGIGSVFFCRTLQASGLLPRRLAQWGLVGYALFAMGGVLQLSGIEVGLVLSVPAGLFEVAVGAYLLAKGFRWEAPVRSDPAHGTDQAARGAVLTP